MTGRKGLDGKSGISAGKESDYRQDDILQVMDLGDFEGDSGQEAAFRPDSEEDDESKEDRNKVESKEEENKEDESEKDWHEEGTVQSEELTQEEKEYLARRAERQRRRQIQEKRKRRKQKIMMGILGTASLAIIAGALVGIWGVLKDRKGESAFVGTNQGDQVQAPQEGNQVQEPQQPAVQEPTVMEQAERMAAQYDYDGAIALLQSQEDFGQNGEMQQAVQNYENIKASCVEYPLDQITHVFYHTLVKDPSKAFDGDSKEAGYNQVMTTIEEFNKITQSMYDRGYVMVSVHDMASFDENGNLVQGSILLPPGKIPFVLSQDDVSYYHYMDGDGFASRLIVDEQGQVKCEYKEDDGSVSVGDYDMVPLIDRFVEEHPDFSYRGRKGILAMTGYNGVLGYRTDIAYKTGENLDDNQIQFLNQNPDFDFDREVEEAAKVANAMKANGWEFASHTWGHQNAAKASAEKLQADDGRWQNSVAPILGRTDVIIFAFGADIGGVSDYNDSNPKFNYYKAAGYNYFCNVDSSQYWVQLGSNYFRQGRRNLDGYRMYYNPEMLADLFDVSAVWDSSRPTPVPPMG